jgi:selenocysteine lyase/cysteine desulfurase
LMRLAAELLAARCTRILVTDLEWPGFVRILSEQLTSRSCSLLSVPISKLVFEPGSSSASLAHHLATCYRDDSCDGLFLSAVSHIGVRLPISEFTEVIGSGHKPRFVVVDGSQAIGHLPSPLTLIPSDFFIAGSHKWLGAYRPLGIALVGDRAATGCREKLPEPVLRGRIDDQLLAYLTGAENGSGEPFSETVDPSGLFAAGAAIALAQTHASQELRYTVLRDNADFVADGSRHTGWDPLRPDSSLRTGILHLRARTEDLRQ